MKLFTEKRQSTFSFSPGSIVFLDVREIVVGNGSAGWGKITVIPRPAQTVHEKLSQDKI